MEQRGMATQKRVMKPSGAAVSLQEELVAAIHGAFEVAVEIAVREVKKLVNQTTNATNEELRRENESLKRRLQRVEAELGSVRLEESHDSPPASSQLLMTTMDTNKPPHCSQIASYPKASTIHGCSEVRGDTPAGCNDTNDPPGPQNKHMTRNEEQNFNQGHPSDPAPHVETGQSKEANKKISNASLVKEEGLISSHQDPGSQDCGSPLLPSKSKEVTVKQEKLEEARDGSSFCLESIKLEDFSLDCMSAVQSKMLEEWKPEVLNIQSQDPNFQLSDADLEEADSPNPTTSIPPSTDVPSLSSEFPNIFQLAEPASVSEAPPQVFGVHVRSSRSLNHNVYACKNCGQAFHLPSLLRRHYGQCQQRLQYRCQQPMAGGKRARLQLYPPGCSPFCCTVCNREFNRLENLKTHLRIHTGERPYTCSVCAKCFRHSGALTRHFRIHTGEKPYVCDQCGKSFRNCGGLKFHQRSHNKQLQ